MQEQLSGQVLDFPLKFPFPLKQLKAALAKIQTSCIPVSSCCPCVRPSAHYRIFLKLFAQISDIAIKSCYDQIAIFFRL